MTGKLVRYLVEDGAEVEAGKPFAEAEAMKMIIQLKAAEGGKVTHEKQPGSIINQGDLLASLELKDPSKVKKILQFDGKLSYEGAADKEDTVLQAFRSSRRKLELVMDGYVLERTRRSSALSSPRRSRRHREVADGVVLGQKLPANRPVLQGVYATTLNKHVDGEDSKETAALCDNLYKTIDSYVNSQIEEKREGSAGGGDHRRHRQVREGPARGRDRRRLRAPLALRRHRGQLHQDLAGRAAALVKANPDPSRPSSRRRSRTSSSPRSDLVNTLLRNLAEFPERFGVEPLRDLPPAGVVVNLSQLPGAAYKDVALTAAKFGLMKAEKPFDEAVAAQGRARLVGRRLRRLLALGRDQRLLAPSPTRRSARPRRSPSSAGTAPTTSEMETATAGDMPTVEFKYKAADKAPGVTLPELRHARGRAVGGLARPGDPPRRSRARPAVQLIHIALASGIPDTADARRR